MHLLLLGGYLLGAGVVAGLTSSMAGLASIVSYPVFLSLGLPPVVANVTNTAALIFTGAGSTLSQQPELRAHVRSTLTVTLWTLLGGIAGAFILVLSPPRTFARIVPFLIAAAGGLMLVANRRDRPATPAAVRLAARPTWQRRLAHGGQAVAMFLVGLYIGYFGASAGIILLAIVSVTLNQSFAVSTAIMNFACWIANILSLVVYQFNSTIHWGMAITMGIGFFIGGYIGPVVVRHVPVRPMRFIITGLAFALAVYLFVTTYF